MEDGISDGHGCKNDDGLGGGEIGIDRKAWTIAPGLF